MTPYHDAIAAAAEKHGLAPVLLEAQVLVESSGQTDAFRWESEYYVRYVRGNPAAKAARFGPLAACSFGLLQVMLETACELGFTGQPQDLFVPQVGLDWGAADMASLLAWTGGDYHRSWAAYNGGRGAAQGTTFPPAQQRYVDHVLQVAKSLGATV